MSLYAAQLQSFIVAGSGQVIGDTTMTFTQMLTIGGVPLTMASLGTVCYMTIEPNTVNEEQIQFTGLTQNSNGTATITGVSSVGFLTPYTVTSGFANTHAGGVTAIITNTSAFYSNFANVLDPETISGLWTFSTSPVVPTPTTSTQVANKGYVDGVAIAGAPNASTTVKGIGLVSVAPVSSTSPIFVGQNDPILPTQNQTNALAGNDTTIAVGTGNKFVTQTGLQNQSENYGVTTGSANAYVLTLSPVPTAYKTGMVIRFTTNFANTGTPTINVNSLGAKTIQYNGSALTSGQLANGSTYTATYDGTYFQVSSVFSNSLSLQNNGILSITTNTATSTIAHGLGVTPKIVRINAAEFIYTSTGTSGYYAANSYGIFNGTTVSNINTYAGFSSIYTELSSTHVVSLGLLSSSNETYATIALNSTNIVLTWTYGMTPTGTYPLNLVWEAQA